MNLLININLILFIIIFFLFFKVIITSISNKRNIFGAPPINKYLFILGKLCNFACWGIFLYEIINSLLTGYHYPIILPIISSVSLLLSTFLIFLSFKDLSDFIKFGLPDKKTELIDIGIYKFSRNPMYVGFYLLSFSSIVFFPELINIIFASAGTLIHHYIIYGEEKYLDYTFGTDWIEYKNKVRRYF